VATDKRFSHRHIAGGVEHRSTHASVNCGSGFWETESGRDASDEADEKNSGNLRKYFSDLSIFELEYPMSSTS
jgi:hypothetical protein